MNAHVNLLTDRFRFRRRLRRAVQFWSAALLASLVAVALLTYAQNAELSQLEARRASLARQYTPIERLQQRRTQLRREIKRLRDEEAIMLQLATHRPALQLVGVVSRSAREHAGELSVDRMTLSPPARQTNSKQAPRRQELSLRGTCRTNLAAAQFVAALRDCGLFYSVILEQIEQRSDTAEPIFTYNIRCYL